MALTVKQEKFCQTYVETGDASEAYRSAYSADKMKPETVHNKAYQLRNQGEIRARIDSLRDEMKSRHDITVSSLLKELEEARKAALSAETPQSAAAVAATMGKAKLTGLDKQIVELTGKNGGAVQVVSMSPDDIKRVMENDDC
ncbi:MULTISPECIES: terminase small subunit [Providencia]|uniref:terminase small subunit n=1 Tax=Providencia TaxID=586 RepID=UPI0010BE5CC8|nr:MULTISPECIES: terminase small subunit [Providencia]QIF66690.1 terminase small subunit [Providencia sp. 1709051003]